MNIFQQLLGMTEFCMAVCATQLLSMVIFEHKHFTRYWGSDAFKEWWDVLLLPLLQID